MTLTIRRLPTNIIDELKSRAHRNERSLEAELRVILTAAAVEPDISWRCFHCGDVFTTPEAAAAHFGIDQLQDPGCVQVLRHGEGHLLDRIRDLEQDLRRYRDDDSDIMRWRQAKASEHAQAVTRAEEDGYAKGVRDMLALSDQEIARMREGRKAA